VSLLYIIPIITLILIPNNLLGVTRVLVEVILIRLINYLLFPFRLYMFFILINSPIYLVPRKLGFLIYATLIIASLIYIGPNYITRERWAESKR